MRKSKIHTAQPKHLQRSPVSRACLTLGMLLAGAAFAPAAMAGAGWADNVDKAGVPFKQATYYANSPSGIQADHSPTATAVSTRDTGTALRKFVDNLPLVDGYVTDAYLLAANASTLGRHIPTAIKEVALAPAHSVSFPDADYYEIAVVEYREQLHSDLPPVVKTATAAGPAVTGGTTLRGYVQIWTSNLPATTVKTQLYYLNGAPILDNKGAPVFAVGDGPHYLGPIIDSQSGVAVRLKFDNYLPTGHFDPITKTRGGDIFIPTDTTVPGSGPGPNGLANPAAPTPADYYTQNRALIHMHGGDTPWISDGEPHSWITPAGETTQYPRGETTQNVPDMPDPGAGAQTYYYPNNQSARMMWYHDHSYGATRINVYAGIVSAFMLHDATEAALKTSGALPLVDIPLIFEDKTFVPKDVTTQDAKWSVDGWGSYGDLWFPHVYETNQNPNSIDGTNPAGRWDYGPWFWPVFPAPLGLPTGVIGDASGVQEAFSDTPVINGVAYPNLNVEPKAYRFRLLNASGQRYLNLGLYVAEPLSVAVANPGSNYSLATTATIGADANGVIPTATLTISPIGAPAVTILQNGAGYSAGTTVAFSGGGATTQATGHVIIDKATGGIVGVVVDTAGSGYTSVPSIAFIDPLLVHVGASTTTASNLATAIASLTPGGQILGITLTAPAGKTLSYATAPAITVTDPTANGSGVSFVTSINTEVPMVAAVQPLVNPAYGLNTYDGRPGGIPDPTAFGPDIIHVGTEGGFLAQPNVIHSTPVSYQQLRRIVTVLNVLDHGLYVGPAERADFVVDFSQFAGKTLIAYNDSPAPNPGFDTRVDYYSGNPDQTGSGGADTTLPGYGPNTRTIMRIQVGATLAGGLAAGPAFDPLGNGGPLATALPAAFAASQDKPIVPEAWQNTAYGTNFGDNLARIYAGSTQQPNFTYNTGGAQTMTGFHLDSAGVGFTIAPAVQLVGGLDPANPLAVVATAHAVLDLVGKRVASVVLDSAGVGYISPPTVVLAGGDGIGAAATAVTSATVSVHVSNKGIQELFEQNYGRMNATFSSELPYTSALTQTTIPLGYVDPPTEQISDGEVQFWKVTHNGVDTHTVHFHLFNVQVINRVGWDGTVVALDPAEYGWKETVKMNPLEDIYVAVKPKSPRAPFGVPQSIRALDPTQPLGVTTGFSQVDPTTGLATTIKNQLHNFDWEYVWHCHILGHEENDFMRPISFNFGATVPPVVTATTFTPGTQTVTWVDPTPAGAATTFGNKGNEIGFIIQRSDNGAPFAALPATIPQSAVQATQNPAGVLPAAIGAVVAANVTSYLDPVAPVATTAYQVVAFNSAGYSSASQVVGAPGAVNSLSATVGAWNVAVSGFPVVLTWTSPTPPTTGFTIVRSGGIDQTGAALADVTFTINNPTVRTFTDPSAAQSSTFTYKIQGVSGTALSPTTLAVVHTAWAPPPALGAVTAAAPLTTPVVTLSWPAPASTAFVTAYQITRTGGGVTTVSQVQQFINALNGVITPPATTFVDTSTVNHTAYSYAVAAVNGSGPTAQVGVASTLNVTSGYAPAPALAGAAALVNSPTQVTLTWSAAPAGSFVTGYNVIRTLNGVATTLVSNAAVPGAGVTPSYVDSTAVQNSTYTYTVQWVNGPNLGTAMTTGSVTTPYAPAGAVTNLTAADAATGITLSWIDAGPTTAYSVSRCQETTLNANCTAPGTVFTVLTTTLTATTFTDPVAVGGVVAGGAYTYQVQAQNGTGAPSAVVSVQGAAVALPLAPAFTAAPTIAAGSIGLRWSASAAPATGYLVQRSTDSGLTWANLSTVTGRTVVTYTDNALTVGTNYQYRIFALETVAGLTLQSALPSATQTAAYAVPAIPVIGTTTFAAGKPVINWTEPAFTGPAVSGYDVFANGALLGSTTTARTFTHAAAVVGTTYVYQVVAKNVVGASVGSATSALVYATQAVPVISSATIVSATRTTLAWSETPVAGAPAVTGYQVWSSVNGAAATQVATTTGALTVNVNGLVAGNTYVFTVRAVNAVGVTLDSTPVTVVNTAAAAPAAPALGTAVRNNPVATSTTDTVSLTFTPVANVTNGAPVTGYVVEYSNGGTATFATVTRVLVPAAGPYSASFANVARGTAAAAPTSSASFRVRAQNAVTGTGAATGTNGATLTLAPASLQ